MEPRRLLVRELIEARGLLVGGPFRLRSGRVSRIYVDARRLYSRPLGRRVAATLLASLAARHGIDADAVLGVATGGIGWGVLVAEHLGLPAGYVRPERKDHGTGRLVEAVDPPARVILVDDVATTGGALAEAAEAARGEGFRVTAALVLVDRCMGARERLEGLGVPLYRVYTIREIVEIAEELGVDVEPARQELAKLAC